MNPSYKELQKINLEYQALIKTQQEETKLLKETQPINEFPSCSQHKDINVLENDLTKYIKFLDCINQIMSCLIRDTTLDEALSEICKILVNTGCFNMCWIGCVNETSKEIEPKIIYGDPYNFFKNIKYFADERPEGQKPIGVAIRENRTIIVQEAITDPNLKLWQSLVIKNPWKSSISLPFQLENNTRAVLMILSNETNYFREQEISMLETVVLKIKNFIERNNIKKALKESEYKFRRLIEQLADGFELLDIDGNFLETNEAHCKMHGYLYEEMLKQNILNIDHNLTIERYKNEFNAQLEKPALTFESTHHKKNGTGFPVEVTIRHVNINNKDYMFSMVRDITEIKLARQNMFKTIIDTQENERRKFAMELHDGIGPLLSAAKLYLDTHLKTTACKNDKTSIYKSIESINESINTIKEISNNLSPQMLINLGLIDTVNSFINKIRDLNILTLVFKHRITCELNTETETTIYRIITELINNSIKHSGATNIELEIKTVTKNKTNLLLLNYFDNGKGFSIDEILKEKKGMGLINIFSRIESLKGTVKFTKKEPTGIAVAARISLQ